MCHLCDRNRGEGGAGGNSALLSIGRVGVAPRTRTTHPYCVSVVLLGVFRGYLLYFGEFGGVQPSAYCLQ